MNDSYVLSEYLCSISFAFSVQFQLLWVVLMWLSCRQKCSSSTVPLFWIPWVNKAHVLGTQHLSMSRWFSFPYTSENGIFFCTREDWQVFVNIINCVGPASVPQKSVVNLVTSTHSGTPMEKLVFYLFLYPHTLSWAKKTLELLQVACTTHLPVVLSELPELPKVKSQLCVDLGVQRVKLSTWINCFISSLKNFI